MASGNGRRANAWTWDEALCGVVPPLISPLDSTGQPDAAAIVVPGLGNVVPAPMVALCRAAARSDAAECSRFQDEVTALCEIYGGEAHWLPSLKAACAALGLGNGVPAPPLVALDDDGRARVSALVRRHAGLVAR